MVEIGQAAFGLFLLVGGALLAIDHPAIDWLNRWLTSAGTNQRPADIEMDENAAFVGFLVGSVTVIAGLMLIADAVA